MTLHDWQARALEFYKTNLNCIIEAATGTGKTYLAVNILKHIFRVSPESSVLIIVPKNVILEDTWYKELVPVFGLADVGMYYGEIKEKCKITLSNMQNIHKVGIDEFDCVIYDEVHNYMSARMLHYLKKEKQYKLGLTATLKRRDLAHWPVLEHFGFNLFKYELAEGVKEEILSKYNFHNIGLTMDESDFDTYNEISSKLRMYSMMKKAGKWSGELQLAKYNLLDQRKQLLGSSAQKISSITVLKTKLLGRKVIVFNEYNKVASDCYWLMVDLGFKPCIFNSDIPKKIRMANLDGFRDGKFDTIITTRALDEGYNLPKIDVALILCGGSSSRQMIQRAGRVLRKKETIADIYQVYFLETIEEEQALKRYELMQASCNEYTKEELVI